MAVMAGGNVTLGISRDASTVPCVGQSPYLVCVSVAMVVLLGLEMCPPRSLAHREPAESTKGDQETADTPRSHDQQVGDGKPRTRCVGVVRREQGSGEGTHRKRYLHVDEPVGQNADGDEDPEDEVKREHHR